MVQSPSISSGNMSHRNAIALLISMSSPRDPKSFLLAMKNEFGPAVRFRIGSHNFIYVSDPQIISHIIEDNRSNYTKWPWARMNEKALGDGVATSEDPLHDRQRSILRPAFRTELLLPRIGDIVDTTVDQLEKWKGQECLDLRDELLHLGFKLACLTMFDVRLGPDSRALSEAANGLIENFDFLQALPVLKHIASLRIRKRLLYARNLKTLDDFVDNLIETRLLENSGQSPLAYLVNDYRQGEQSLSDRKLLRDEAMTLLATGHETIANTLAWFFYLLVQNPKEYGFVVDEIGYVLQNHYPSKSELDELVLTRRALLETLRLYPIVWGQGLVATRQDCTKGLAIEPDEIAVVSQLAMHNDPDYWISPDSFQPNRFTVQRTVSTAYFPFGGGVRRCLGEQLAWLKLLVIAATVVRHVRFKLNPESTVKVQYGGTLRPRGLLMTVDHVTS